MFISTVSRNLNGLFVVVEVVAEVLAILLVELWDPPPPPHIDRLIIGNEITACGFLHHCCCFCASLHIAPVLIWTRW